MSTVAPISVVISYSPEDEAFCQDLEKHLQAMQRQQLIQVWSDRNIHAGTDREQQMNHYLNTADIILLLISPDFVASDHHYNVEMQQAMKRHENQKARVIPVILRPVSREGTPLAALETLPTDGKPITDLRWHTRDDAFHDVAENIEKVVHGLLALNNARLHMAAERYDQALEAYEQALQFDRRSATIYAGKGDVLLHLGYFSEALDAYSQALHLDPTSPTSERGRGVALMGLKLHQEALSAFSQAILLDSTIAAAHRGKGDALVQLHKFEEALEAYDEALRLNPEDAQSYVSKGYVLEQLAQQAFKMAKRLGYSGEKYMEQIDHSSIQMQSLPIRVEELTLIQTISLPSPDPSLMHPNPELRRLSSQYLVLTAIAMSPDGRFLASTPETENPDATFGATLWDVKTGKVVRTVGEFNGKVSYLLFSSDGQTLLSSGTFFKPEPKNFLAKRLASIERQAGLGSHRFQAWSLKTGESTQRFPVPSDARNCMISANEQVLVSYSGYSPKILNFSTGKSLDCEGSGTSITLLAVSLDGTVIVGVGKITVADNFLGSMLILWDAPTGKILHNISELRSVITSVAISPDKQMIASGYENGTIKLWSLSTAQLLYSFVGHESSRFFTWRGSSRRLSSDLLGNPLIFSTDGHQIISTAGGEIKIWKIEK